MNAPGASFSALQFPFADVLPQPAQMLEVADGVWWVRMPLPFALNHINLWLLRDQGQWTLVDTGYGNDETRSRWTQLLDAPSFEGTISRVMVTHDHPDHIGNADWFARRFDCQPWMTEPEFLAAHMVKHDLAGFSNRHYTDFCRRHGMDARRLALLEGESSYADGVPSLPDTYHRIFGGDRIAIDARSWLVIPGYGHSPEHASLYCEELGVLIAGDMLLPSISTNISVWGVEPDADPLKLFLDSLSRFEALPADTLVLPSHGRPFRGIASRVEMLRTHHRERLEALQRALETPRSAMDVLPVLFERTLNDQQVFFALGESIAHLNHLMHAGLARRISGQDGVYRFIGTTQML